jgi:cytochrome c oxidase subunit 4
MKIQDRTQTQAKIVEQSHPTFRTFVTVGLVLFALTGAEFGIVYLTGLRPYVLAGLAVLATLKFFLVASYFMHLKWDARLLRWAFVVGLALAVLITIAQRFVNQA